MPAKSNRRTLHAALDQVAKDAAQIQDWPEKQAQLHAALATAHMVIDQLHDNRPYTGGSNG